MLRVIAGKYRGKIIPFNNSKFGMADVTMQKVKEALFSIINDRIAQSRFLDLFACSGQIGIEALSRGAAYVHFNEKDIKRYKFLKSLEDTILKSENVCFTNMDSMKLISELSVSAKKTFDIIFADPPYSKNKTSPQVYNDIINLIVSEQILCDDGILVIQHYKDNYLETGVNGYTIVKRKDYGTNSLTIYAKSGYTDEK